MTDKTYEELREDFNKLQEKCNELNDFNNSQAKKILTEKREVELELMRVKGRCSFLHNEIKELQWEHQFLTDRIEILERSKKDFQAQIEKMKCCENCAFWVDSDCVLSAPLKCKRWCEDWQDDYWELAE